MQLFYRKFGKGKAFIILHGLFGNSDHWVSIGKKIADLGFEVYLLDQRNHGQSPKNALFNYSVLANDLLEFICEHNLTKPIIMGHSMGGKVVMSLAVKNAKIVSKLIVVDISLRAYKIQPELHSILKAMKEVDHENITSRNQVELILQKHISDFKIRMLVMKNLHRIDKNRYAWRLHLDAIYNNINLLFESVKTNQPISIPTLFIRGGASDYIQDRDILTIKKAFPKASIQTIDGANHWVQVEAPERFFAMISEFISL